MVFHIFIHIFLYVVLWFITLNTHLPYSCIGVYRWLSIMYFIPINFRFLCLIGFFAIKKNKWSRKPSTFLNMLISLILISSLYDIAFFIRFTKVISKVFKEIFIGTFYGCLIFAFKIGYNVRI